MTRNETIADLYKDGWTQQQIGNRYAISRERVRQLLQKQGLTGANGGQSVSIKKEKIKRAAAEIRRQAEIRKRKAIVVRKAYGCSLEFYEKIGGGRTTCAETRSFATTRSLKRHFNIGWELTLEEWWNIWNLSGKASQRGTKREDYCMARFDKSGPYTAENVKIVKVKDSKNIKEGGLG